MSLIGFLVFLVKILGLIFAIGLLLDLIFEVVIMTPIRSIGLAKKRKEAADLILDKLKNNETEEEIDK